jgi:S-adenosylmethionine synthetase
MKDRFFTAESVRAGHPDKVADRISDAILDACLSQDANSLVACETLVTNNLVTVAGEISSVASLDIPSVVHRVARDIGGTQEHYGFSQTTPVQVIIQKQTPILTENVRKGFAGDQGIMVGYATKENPSAIPTPLWIAHHLVRKMDDFRCLGASFLGPDGKSQVTVQYENDDPLKVTEATVSTQHDDTKSLAEVRYHLSELIETEINSLGYEVGLVRVNPQEGLFMDGGPKADTGLTGRKIVADAYGPQIPCGGGAFSGKDPSKLDRSGAYAARMMAKSLVKAGLVSRCQVQLSYIIGVRGPARIEVDDFGTGTVSQKGLLSFISSFDLSTEGIIERLNLRRPLYEATSFYGHFGDRDFPWEKENA